MTRQRRGLRSPDGVDLEKIPSEDRNLHQLHRAVAARHAQPWWFSCRAEAREAAGRFDLAGPECGTCYFALTPVGALLERIADPEAADPPLVTTRTLEQIVVWSGVVPGAHRIADTTVASVPQLTAEISTTEDYALPWQWADAFSEEGRQGILYEGRFSRVECVALFGEAGDRPLDDQPAPLTSQPAVVFEEDFPLGWRMAITTTPSSQDSVEALPPDEAEG
jgi:hypothetical protein